PIPARGRRKMFRTIDGNGGLARPWLEGGRLSRLDREPELPPMLELPRDGVDPREPGGPAPLGPPPPPPPPPEPPWAAYARRLDPDPAVAANYDYGPVLAGGADDNRIHPVDQGNSNACGTSSLSMIMDYLGKPSSREQIDGAVRRTDFGATPGPLIEYARDHGLEAEGYNNGTWEAMRSFVERGIPVQAIYNTQASGNPSDGHIVAVVGFRTNKDTGQEEILFRNSNNG